MYKTPYQKNITILICILAAVCLTGCRKNQFKTDFDLPADVNETFTLTYYAADSKGGRLTESVVTLNKGKAEVVSPEVLPSLVYITSMSSPIPKAVFYAERGDNFKVTGKGADPLYWNVTGNSITDRLTEWRVASAKTIGEWMKNPEGTATRLNKLVADYVAAHPDDPASTIILLTYYDRRHDESGFLKCRNMLRNDAALAKWSELTARTDVLALDPPAKLPSKLLFKTANGCDTVVPGRAPTLLYFASTKSNRSMSDKDSLRKISRHYADSSRRVIVDISFEKDSVSRIYSSRNDSLKNAVIAWMPLGLSDPTARQLGVDRVPWTVVIGENGKVIYSGSDFKKAADDFRKQLK